MHLQNKSGSWIWINLLNFEEKMHIYLYFELKNRIKFTYILTYILTID